MKTLVEKYWHRLRTSITFFPKMTLNYYKTLYQFFLSSLLPFSIALISHKFSHLIHVTKYVESILLKSY